MSIVADFTVPADAFCLGDALDTVPDATAELARLVAHSPRYVMPFVWVLGTDAESFDAAVADDPTVDTGVVTDSFDDALLYQFTWNDVVSARLETILDHEGAILEARGSGDEWRLWVRFGSREHFSDFRDHFRRYGPISLHQLTPPQAPGDAAYGVTAKQREALLAAYDSGYWETPSTVTGEELAQRLGISQQAVSRRLRRGIDALLKDTLDRHRDE